MWTTVVVVVAAVVATVVAELNSDSDPYVSRSQSPRQQCSGYCKASTKFGLLKGQTYIYQYEGVVSTGIEGATLDTSVINVLAEAHLRVEETPCELTLLVRNAQLYDSGPAGLQRSPHEAQWAGRLEQWPLRLSYIDGRVEQLCPAAEELSWTLDFKRALLSALQNSMPDLTSNTHLHERDVSGTCETTYTVSPIDFGNVEILRHKDLHSCSGRGSHSLGLSGALPSSTPVVRSEQICKQKISDNDGPHITSVECYETHVFTPFSNDQGGLRTQANLTMVLVDIIKNEGSSYTDLFVNRRTSLKGEFITAGPEELISSKSVVLTLEQLSSESHQGVSENVPQLFNLLVHQMSALDDQQLVKIFDEIEEKRARQFFLDALPLVGTAGSVKVMYLIYKAAEVSRDELETWLSAIAFHKEPTLDMLNTLNLIIQEEGFHPKAWLAVGAVVHSYCQQDSACHDTPEVKNILEYLTSHLGEYCYTTNKFEQQVVVAALKAIGNAGIILSVDTLQNCILIEENVLEVRLAAISAIRRLPCSLQNKLPLLQIFTKLHHDSELRIAAYLAIMQCPTAVSLNNIKESLYMGDVNQVLTFVWTHLSNHKGQLDGSWSSWGKEIHKMLQDSYLANKFKTDIRKFSRNYATSLHSNTLNMGASIDSNIVFSPKSYLPRSAYLNLTVDLFGEAVNLIEIGTRLEGFESMVEDLFSPSGYFPDESLQMMLRSMRSSEIEKKEVIQSMSDQFTKGVEDEPQGSIFARVFGNELYLTQFSSLNKLIDVKKPIKYNGKYLIDSLQSLFDHKKIDYTKSYKIINSQYVIPTVVGFPLRVEVNGTAAVSFEMKTELDVFNILKTKSGDIGVLFNPSAVVQIDGKMMVDAVFAQSAVETKGSLKTNTYLDLKMSIDKLKIMDVVINIPKDKIEVIDVKSAVYIRQREQLVKLEGVGEMTQWDTCSGVRVPTISGMRGCSQLEMRNASTVQGAPFFPLTGTFHYAFVLQKTDNFNAYKFHFEQEFKSLNQNTRGKLIVSLDTPGSRLNRKLSAELTLTAEDKTVDAALVLTSPWTNVDLKGQLVRTEGEWSLDLSTQLGNKQVAAARVAMHQEMSDQNIRFEPSLLVRSEPWGINFNMSGHFSIVSATQYTVGLTLNNPTEVLSISGEVSKSKGRYSSIVAFKTADIDVKVSGRIVNTPTLMSCKAQADYTVGTSSSQGVQFSTKLQSNFKPSLTKQHLTLNLKMSQWEQYNTKASWVLYQGDRHCGSKAELAVGRTQWIQQLTYRNSLQQEDKHLEFTLSLESPTKNLDYRTELLYKIDDELVHAHALAQLNKKNRFISLFEFKRGFPFHRIEMELASPWKRVALEAKLEVANFHETEFNGTVIVKWGDIVDPQWVSAGGRYFVQETALSTHHHVEGWMEGKEWVQPLRLKGEWSARSEQGLILSHWYLNVTCGTDSYKTSAFYTKNPSLGKHDLKLDLVLPENAYSSTFVVINNLELKNITVRLDLERTIYFTSQLQGDLQFETQLFWDFLQDHSQNVWLQYRGSDTTEVAIISLPAHYASLTVEKLGQGLSSMNITAVWGESEGSANNAILLSTYWLLDPNTYVRTSLPIVYTHVHLTTPFVGFEHQSFEFHMNGSSYYYGYPFTKDIHVSTKWQDQFVILNFKHISRMVEGYDGSITRTTFTGEVKSSLKIVEVARVKIDVLEDGQTPVNSIIVDAAFNKWAALAFNTKYDSSKLAISVNLTDMIENKIILSGDLTIAANSVVVKATLPKSKHILFESEYSNWPNRFQANLVTPIDGFEVSMLQYHTEYDNNRIETKIIGKAGKQFATFSAMLGQSEYGLHLGMNTTSSSSVPDVTLSLKHEFYLDRNKISLNELAFIDLSKNEETIQSGQVLVYFTDERPSLSTRSRNLQTILQLPGHYSSTNYSYETQVKLTGVEAQHNLVHLWNTDKIEVSLIHEGVSSISGFLNKNGEKKAEFYFQNINNQNYRTDVILPGGYGLQHRLFIMSWTNWDNTFSLFTPNQKMIIKNVQTLNGENTAYVHKSTFFFNKEFSFVDVVINLDATTGSVNNVLFQITTPWSYPVKAKYDLIVKTGPTTKHAVEFKLKKDLEIKAEFDVTMIDASFMASFNLFSPLCKQLKGSVNLEYEKTYSKVNGFLLMDNNQVSVDLEIVKNIKNPKFKFSFNDANRNILHLSCSYDVTKSKNEASLKTSYFEQEIYLNGYYFIEVDQIKAGLKANTPFHSLKELLFDLELVLSREYSMFIKDMKKGDKLKLFSETGPILQDLIKLSVSLDYIMKNITQKHSSVFKFSTAHESGFVSFHLRSNDTNTVEISLKGYTESDHNSNKKSYILGYNGLLPFEGLGNTTLDVKYACNEIKCQLTGNTNINSWHSSVKAESTFDNNGVGHMDVTVMTVDKKIEFYVKHKIDEAEDNYFWHLLRDGQFIDGTMSINNSTNGYRVTYNIESSVYDMRKIRGNVSFELSPKLFAITSSLSVNDELEYTLIYSALITTNKTEHKLKISVPFEGFENINGHLEYVTSSPYYYDVDIVQGNISFGAKTNTVSFNSQNDTKYWNCSIDLPSVLKFAAQYNESGLEVDASIVPNYEISKLSFNLVNSDTVLTINAVKDLTELLVTVKKEINYLIVYGAYNKHMINAIVGVEDKLASLNVTSNIPNWREISVVLQSFNGKKFVATVSKEKQHFFHFLAETLGHWQNEGFMSLAIPTFFMEMNVKYDLSSDLSINFNYNFNGNMQNAKGKVTFLSDSTQIELATPIQGFEDLTLIGNLNRNDRKAGFIFRNKEQQYDIALSVSVQSKMVELKGTVVNGKSEFTLSIGAQNGTDDESKCNSLYISAFKNKKSLFWLSFEGLYDLNKKAGIKISFSSYYHNQIYLEILSFKREISHTLFLNYLSGNEYVCLLNTTLVKEYSKPQLLIESEFGMYKNYIEMSYSNLDKRKTIVFNLKQSNEKLLNIQGEVSIEFLASDIRFALENKDILPIVNSMNIVSNYNFINGSYIDLSYLVNNDKYFELYMESHSLTSVDFRSSLKSSDYIKHSYYISLAYQLDLPVASISTDVNINSDFYKCTGNLTWNTDLAATFFQLTTNAGYGFENAVLSTQYKFGDIYSHMIDFTVDKSILFRVACDISFPSQVSVQLVLPDTLFLSNVREISGEYKFTNDEKKIKVHYKSDSNDQSFTDFLILFKNQHYSIDFVLTKNNPILNYNFQWLLYFTQDEVEFRTNLVWENETLFTAVYRKELPEEDPKDIYKKVKTPLSMLFGLENNYSWNVTATKLVKFKFIGSLNSTDITLYVTHPSTIYHQQFKITNVEWTESIGSESFFQAYYNNAQMTELLFQYTDIFKKLLYHVHNNIEIVYLYNCTVKFTEKLISISGETTFRDFSPHETILTIEHLTKVTGVSEDPLSLFFEMDVQTHKFVGGLSTSTQNISFGGYVNDCPDQLCYNVSFFFNSSSILAQPFSIKYESDCKNKLHASTNLFEDDTINLFIDKANRITRFNIHGQNIPYFKTVAVACEFSSSAASINGTLGKDNLHIQLKNSTYIHSLELKTSYETLKILKISHEMDSSERHHSGVLVVKGSKSSLVWDYSISASSDGLVVFKINSNKTMLMKVTLDLSRKKEILIQLMKDGKLLVAKGTVDFFSSEQKLLGDVSVKMNEKEYQFSIERVTTSSEIKAKLQLTTPSDDYFIEAQMNKQADHNLPYVSVKYKTPINPFDFADINIWYSTVLINDWEYLSIEEKNMSYNMRFFQTTIGLSLRTNTFVLDDIILNIISGDKYGLCFNYLSKKIDLVYFLINDVRVSAIKSIIDFQGFTLNNSTFLIEKTSIIVYLDKFKIDGFLSIETPATGQILFISELIKDIKTKNLGEEIVYFEESNRTSKLVVGKETYITFTSHINNEGQYTGDLFAKFMLDKTFNFSYAIYDDSVLASIEFINSNEILIDAQFLYSNKKTDKMWSKTAELTVNKFMSVSEQLLIKPKVVIIQEKNEKSIVKYHLNVTNGFKNELSLSGNCSVSLPNLSSFSLDSKPSLNIYINVNTYTTEYTAAANISLQSKRLEAAINLIAIELLANSNEDSDFASLELGGLIENDSVSLYFNKNKLLVSLLNNVENETNISAYLSLETLGKNVSFDATVNYNPIFSLRISHTMFPTPCTVDVKVDLREESIESALNIFYNGLEQQAFVNIYLDSNPKYAELIYLDIWKQTHDVSVKVDENDDEVTVRGKINSPALDENFLVVTLGKLNDKIDLNINDDCFFKAYKDESRVLLDLHFGGDYKMNFKSENEIQISISSPLTSGDMSFKLSPIYSTSYFQFLLHSGEYQLHFKVNTDKLLDVVIVKSSEGTILNSSVIMDNNNRVFDFQAHFDFLEHKNSFLIKHTHDPILLTVLFNSSYFHNSDLQIILGVRDKDIVSGIFELKKVEKLFSSYLWYNKTSRSVNMCFEAPLFSEMDKAEIKGILNIAGGECEVNLTASLVSADSLLSEGTVYFIRNDEVLASGFVINSTFKNYENVIISLTYPLSLSSDMEARLFLKFQKPYELRLTICFSKENINVYAGAQWQDFIVSLEWRVGVTSFYSIINELNLQFMERKLQIGVWTNPKYPITDSIYFLDIDGKRIVELSYSLILQNMHYKSKLILHTIYKGHEKYGIDCEFKTVNNSTLEKVVKILASIPQLGNDLGIDFGVSYDNLLKYSMLAQVRIPYNNEVKVARFYSLHSVVPNQILSKINHSLEYSGLGSIGWELEVYGQSPFIEQTKMAFIGTKFHVNNNTYNLNIKANMEINKNDLIIVLETPFDQLSQGVLQLRGVNEIVGSELALSYNLETIISVKVTEDSLKTKGLDIFTKWRSVAVRYLYEEDKKMGVHGYLCWDVDRKNTSQIGFTLSADGNDDKYYSDIELTLPSRLIPRLAVKGNFEIANDYISTLMELDFPGLNLEGRFYKESAKSNKKSEFELTWTKDKSTPRHIGFLFASELGFEETKHYFTLQHFALVNDIVLTVYSKKTLCGISVKYSPLKKNEINVELGYWLGIERSGVKLVALHPSTNTLFFGVANVSSTTDHTQIGLSVSYLSNQEPNRVKYVEVYGKRNKRTPQLFVGIASNGNNLVVGGSLWKKENSLEGITLEGRVNQKDPMKLEMVYNRIDSVIEMELSYGLSRSYRMVAGTPISSEIMAQLSHTLYGRSNLDGLASLRLNTSKILWGRFQLPSLSHVSQEIYSSIIAEYSDLSVVSESIVNGFSNFAQEDFSEKALLLLTAVSSTTDVLVSQTYHELEAIKNGVDAVCDVAMIAYKEDHFYLKTCTLLLRKVSYTVYDRLACVFQVMASVIGNILRPALTVCHGVWQMVESVVSRWTMFASELGVGGVTPLKDVRKVISQYQAFQVSLIQHTKLAVDNTLAQLDMWQRQWAQWTAEAEVKANLLTQTVLDMLEQQIRRVLNYKDTVLAGFSVLGDTMAEMLEIVVIGLYDIKEVRYTINTLLESAFQVYNRITQFWLEDHFIRQISDFCDRVIQLVVEDFNRNFGEYEEYLVKAKLLLEVLYKELSKLPGLGYTQKTVNIIYQKAKWIWNYAELNENLKRVVKEFVKDIEASLYEWKELEGQKEGNLRSEYQYDEENNSLTFTQELPFEWRAFNELPYNLKYNWPENKGPIKTIAQEFSETIQKVWLDTKLFPSLIPSFTATALFSPHNIITFDNSYYILSKSCGSYLLSGDLQHHTFLLLADYHSQNGRDLVLIVKDIKITVKENLEVYINGNLEELPSKISSAYHLTIERRVNSISIESQRGFSLECSKFLNMCKFQLSGWYLGKTAGLLGTYNNEYMDDYSTPDHKVVGDDIKSFTNSWAIDPSSCEENDEQLVAPDDSLESMCEHMFSSEFSSLSPCFNEENPQAFLKMCASQSLEDSTCAAVYAYVTKCAGVGVQLEMPDVCTSNSWINATEITIYSDMAEVESKMSADVVFVVESAPCDSINREVVNKLAVSLATELRAHGLSQNHFALVSFGKSVGVHIHTFNGQLWTQDESLLPGTVADFEDVDYAEESQYLSALQTAETLPFRPSASKVVVLLHCSQCPSSPNHTPLLLQRLLQNDANVHVLQQDNLLNCQGKPVSKVIGFETSGAYSHNRHNKLTPPSPQLLKQIRVPQDVCSSLALETNGTVFIQGGVRHLKSWSKRVAIGALPKTATRHCKNTVGNDNVPIWRCHSIIPKNLKDYDQSSVDEDPNLAGSEAYPDYEELDR